MVYCRALRVQRWITNQCTRAAKSGVSKWTISRRRRVIGIVRRKETIGQRGTLIEDAERIAQCDCVALR